MASMAAHNLILVAPLQLDKALQDYNRMREREAAQQEGADAGRIGRAAASRRKSALPVRALGRAVRKSVGLIGGLHPRVPPGE